MTNNLTKAQNIQNNIFYSSLTQNRLYLDEETEEFYTQVSVVAILTVALTLAFIISSL